jgi:hypothetical protein
MISLLLIPCNHYLTCHCVYSRNSCIVSQGWAVSIIAIVAFYTSLQGRLIRERTYHHKIGHLGNFEKCAQHTQRLAIQRCQSLSQSRPKRIRSKVDARVCNHDLGKVWKYRLLAVTLGNYVHMYEFLLARCYQYELKPEVMPY